MVIDSSASSSNDGSVGHSAGAGVRHSESAFTIFLVSICSGSIITCGADVSSAVR